jgi:hypothetical protein
VALGHRNLWLGKQKTMIPVNLGPEPDDFDQRIRQPGLRFLNSAGFAATSVVARAKFKRPEGGKPDYWRAAKANLRAAFKGCCAYSCFLLEDSLTPSLEELSASVDHFQPISQSPAYLACEWLNLRLAWELIDHHKQSKLVPLDPYAIHQSPFCLDVGDFGLLLPREDLAKQQYEDAEITIRALGLNQHNCTLRRRAWADDFMANAHHYGDALMQRWQPFLWQELKRLAAIP